jgi:hypothetical protein
MVLRAAQPFLWNTGRQDPLAKSYSIPLSIHHSIAPYEITDVPHKMKHQETVVSPNFLSKAQHLTERFKDHHYGSCQHHQHPPTRSSKCHIAIVSRMYNNAEPLLTRTRTVHGDFLSPLDGTLASSSRPLAASAMIGCEQINRERTLLPGVYWGRTRASPESPLLPTGFFRPFYQPTLSDPLLYPMQRTYTGLAPYIGSLHITVHTQTTS